MGFSPIGPSQKPPSNIQSVQPTSKSSQETKKDNLTKALGFEETINEIVDQFFETFKQEKLPATRPQGKGSSDYSSLPTDSFFARLKAKLSKKPEATVYVLPAKVEQALNKAIDQLVHLQDEITKEFEAGQPQIVAEIKNSIDLLRSSNEAYIKTRGKKEAQQDEFLKISNVFLKAKAEIARLKETIKTASCAVNYLTSGKAKKVWADEHYVYYTPMGAPFSLTRFLKRAEIQEEVNTINVVNQNLFKNGMTDLIGLLGVEKGTEKLLIDHFGDFKTFINSLSDPNIRKILREKVGIENEKDINRIVNLPNNQSKEIQKILKKGENLVLDFEVLNEEQWIDGDLTVRSELAPGGSLESQYLGSARNKLDMSFEANLKFGQEFLNGMSDLHSAGYVHGDIKVDNILVHGGPSVKISDFGKTRPLEDDQDALYSGNQRYSAPEGRLSKKGEVYSAGVVLIRMLEQDLLGEKDMLIEPQTKNLSIPPSEKRRGIEKFLVSNEKTPQTESSLRGKIKVIGRIFTKKKYPDAQREIHNYIDALISVMEKNSKLDPAKSQELKNLLYQMTLSDPSERPTMAQAAQRYQDIFT